MPLHLVVERGGELLGCAPMYLKSHSYGEYVFDWGWADAYERAGGRYYPKLQVAVPFTPVPGPRLLLRPGAAAESRRDHRAAMVSAADAARRLVAARHLLPRGRVGALRRGRAARRASGIQYHWYNRGYATFDDYLASAQEQQAQDHPQGARAGRASRA